MFCGCISVGGIGGVGVDDILEGGGKGRREAAIPFQSKTRERMNCRETRFDTDWANEKPALARMETSNVDPAALDCMRRWRRVLYLR
jgi:hypothetical protein